MVRLFISRELLDIYSQCETDFDIRKAERDWLDKCEQEYQEIQNIGKFVFLILSVYLTCYGCLFYMQSRLEEVNGVISQSY